MDKRHTLNGMAMMLGANVCFAAMAAQTQLTGRILGAWHIIFFRSIVSCLILIIWLRLRGIALRGNEPSLLWARGIIGYVALQCYFWALPHLPLGTAVMLNYTAPIFAVIASMIWIRERPSRGTLVCLTLSFGGLYFLASPSFRSEPWALLAGLASGLLAGAVHVLIRKTNRSDDPLLIIFYFTLASAIGSGILCVAKGAPSLASIPWKGLWIITLTALGGQLFLTHSLQKAPVWAASPLGFLTPVLGLYLAHRLWGQTLSSSELAGGGLIIIGGAYLVFDFYFRKK